jgi:hypothetical protein
MNNTTQLQTNQVLAVTIKLENIGTFRLNKKRANPTTADFDNIFLEAVDSTLSMLGDSAKEALYLYLKNSYGVSKETLPQNIMAFANMLEQIFGQKAFLIEAQVMEKLHSKVPCFKFYPKQGELSFLNYLQNLRCFMFIHHHNSSE